MSPETKVVSDLRDVKVNGETLEPGVILVPTDLPASLAQSVSTATKVRGERLEQEAVPVLLEEWEQLVYKAFKV